MAKILIEAQELPICVLAWDLETVRACDCPQFFRERPRPRFYIML